MNVKRVVTIWQPGTGGDYVVDRPMCSAQPCHGRASGFQLLPELPCKYVHTCAEGTWA